MSRKNISISDPIDQRAKDLIQARGFTGLSDLVAALIREEYERRHEVKISETSVSPPQPASQPVTYRKSKRKPSSSATRPPGGDQVVDILKRQAKTAAPSK